MWSWIFAAVCNRPIAPGTKLDGKKVNATQCFYKIHIKYWCERKKNLKASSNVLRMEKSESAFPADEYAAHCGTWRPIWWNPLSNTHSIVLFSFSVSLSLWIDCIPGVPIHRIWFKVLAVRMHPLPKKHETKQKDKHRELQEIPHYTVPNICVRELSCTFDAWLFLCFCTDDAQSMNKCLSHKSICVLFSDPMWHAHDDDTKYRIATL